MGASRRVSLPSASVDGSRLEAKLVEEADTSYRKVFARTAIATTQADKEVEEANTFDGVFSRAGTNPGAITGTVTVFVDEGDPGQDILRRAHDENKKANLREFLKGEKVTSTPIAFATADGVGVVAPTATAHYGVLDLTDTDANTVQLRTDLNNVGKGATIKYDATGGTDDEVYLFVSDIVVNAGGTITAVHITPGSGRPKDWDGSAIAAFNGTVEVFDNRDIEKLYVVDVTSAPIGDEDVDATAGQTTSTFGISVDSVTKTLSDPS